MRKIGILSPYKGYFKEAIFYLEELNEKYRSLYFGENEYILEEIVVDPFHFHGIRDDVDVMIAYSGYMELTKNLSKPIPIVEVDIPNFDILIGLMECKQKYGCQKVALTITKRNMLISVKEFEDILGISIELFIIDSLDTNYQKICDLALKRGCEAFLAHYYIGTYAASKGINTVMIQYSKSTFWQAITEAKMAAQLYCLSQEKSVKLNTILDYTDEGIIYFNKQGKITSINQKAMELLNIESETSVLNKTATAMIFGKELIELLNDGSEYKYKIIKINHTDFTIKKIFVHLEEMSLGTLITLQKVNNIQKLEEEIRKQKYGKGHIAKACFKDIIGQSEIMKGVIAKATKYSKTESNILITGESGTGKEIMAQSIHNSSNRKNGPFVAINCAALPETLLESELFGYEEGAFTGAARKGKIGLFELAHNGTIFLDEISELPLLFQAKLLRVIQEKEVYRLGGIKVIPLDVRFISATNQNLKDLVEKGEFREDLYYRLNVLNLNLPSLNERREDIFLLAQHFLDNNSPDIILTNEAKLMLQAFDWPGNIRQLFNICEQLSVLCDDCLVKEQNVRDLLYLQSSLSFSSEGTQQYSDYQMGENDDQKAETLQTDISEAEKIRTVLAAVKYNRNEAAEVLNIHRSTLWRKMKKYGI
ncbi:MAG: sigma 54-interacting transcriptional regulator [Clostridiaceae bacterium]|nr:sigma 54-interacting transcriptional regulator [Clostridiaceae bacterium]